jgi:RNA polymerase sigma-70 factor, ECF subfamily
MAGSSPLRTRRSDRPPCPTPVARRFPSVHARLVRPGGVSYDLRSKDARRECDFATGSDTRPPGGVPLAMLDLEAELKSCADGDKEALRRVFEAEAPRLVGVAQRILRRRDLAEEAVQEGFARIWLNAGRFDPALGSARGWIYAIVRYRALNMLRDGAREDILAPDAVDALRDAEADTAWRRLDADGALRQCLEQLEPNRRKAILLAYVLGLTQGEIAGRMSAPLGTVKAWMRRALIALRECLE